MFTSRWFFRSRPKFRRVTKWSLMLLPLPLKAWLWPSEHLCYAPSHPCKRKWAFGVNSPPPPSSKRIILEYPLVVTLNEIAIKPAIRPARKLVVIILLFPQPCKGRIRSHDSLSCEQLLSYSRWYPWLWGAYSYLLPCNAGNLIILSYNHTTLPVSRVLLWTTILLMVLYMCARLWGSVRLGSE